jgi:hypothetical protein
MMMPWEKDTAAVEFGMRTLEFECFSVSTVKTLLDMVLLLREYCQLYWIW